MADVDGETTLGPAGLDLESLAVAELAVRVEDEYGVKFTDEEQESGTYAGGPLSFDCDGGLVDAL